MEEKSELEELFGAVAELSGRLVEVEKVLETTRAVDHRGISMIASEGLRGGGTIDKSRPFALDFRGLREQKLRVPNEEFLAFFSEGEGEHFKTNLLDLVNTVVRHSGFVESFVDVRKQILELRQKIELFTLYERLYKTETELATLKEKVDASFEEKSSGKGEEEGCEAREEGREKGR